MDLAEFPNLVTEGFEVTSPAADSYNCIAWAAGDSSQWWEPGTLDGYWPPEAPQEFSFPCLIATFEILGYERCLTGAFELGYEKVAFYGTSENDPQHVAKQLDADRWSSKIGSSEDITHTLTGLVSAQYGKAMYFMRRLKTA